MKTVTKWALLITATFAIACSGGSDGDPGPSPDPNPGPGPDVEEPTHDYLIGSLFGFDKGVRTSDLNENANTTLYNLPLFRPPFSDSEWWDNFVEEFTYSGMDYALANCRGVLPNPNKYPDHGDPRRLADLIAAMERRGAGDKFKIAIFDDCPASWAAARNYDLYGSYSDKIDGQYNYPLDNLDGEGGIYKYIWDYNLKIAFQTVPEKYWLKFQNRPVIIFWSVNNFLNPAGTNNYYQKLSPILTRIRNDFKTTFSADPFIIVDKAFYDRDNSVYPPVIDAINNWFTMAEPYTIRSFNNVTVGVTIPGFSINDKAGNRMLVDANHGTQLDFSLSRLVAGKSDIILVEGFTDLRENAALWRSTDTKYYDYPNQRLNIVRKYSKDPYPKEFKVEAETCDFYEDKTTGNNENSFRLGDLDVKKCDDVYPGWCVTNTSDGEWLQWKELPFRAKSSKFQLRYASGATARIRFNVDGTDREEISLPATGNVWTSTDGGTVEFAAKGVHDVTLKIVSGNIDINWFKILAAE